MKHTHQPFYSKGFKMFQKMCVFFFLQKVFVFGGSGGFPQFLLPGLQGESESRERCCTTSSGAAARSKSTWRNSDSFNFRTSEPCELSPLKHWKFSTKTRQKKVSELELYNWKNVWNPENSVVVAQKKEPIKIS